MHFLIDFGEKYLKIYGAHESYRIKDHFISMTSTYIYVDMHPKSQRKVQNVASVDIYHF